MATPEGRVKKKVKKLLDKYQGRIYVYMPVPAGYGAPTLDFLCILHGVGFAIETKEPKAKPTPRQEWTIEQIEAAGGTVFVIAGEVGLDRLEGWLASVDRAAGRKP
jgi:hypothetical protein